jgi:alpha-ribazole phosphatase/probable phosphoglycerate mutase
MVRTRAVAEPLARRLGLNCIPDPQWRERHFGTWEGKSWNAIYRESGNAMDGMVDDPNGFQPGGGETTAAMAMRVQRAMTALATDAHIVVIAHGGPIASAIAIRTGVALEQLAALIPAPGAITSL